ncbi:sugar transferase [Candidatus Peribacteria bacterium]|nr:sugar transferase [Candidatus Peribacteria bacterium]
MRKIHLFFVLGRMLSDAVMTLLGLLLAYYLRAEYYPLFDLAPPLLMPLHQYMQFAVTIAVAVVGVFGLQGKYDFQADARVYREIPSIFWGFTATFLTVVVGFFFLRYYFFSRFIFGMGWVLGLGLVLLGRMGLRLGRRWAYRQGYGRERVVLIGADTQTEQFMRALQRDPRWKLLGHVTMPKETPLPALRHLGELSELEEILTDYGVSQLFITERHVSEALREEIMRIAHRTQTQYSLVPDALSLDLAAVTLSEVDDIPVMHLSSHRISGWGVVLKTLFDRLMSALGLLILSPLMLWVWWRVKRQLVADGHPGVSPIYISRRIGKEGRHFSCYKFRSMVPGAHRQFLSLHEAQKTQKAGEVLQIQNDPRVTPLGHWLRQTSIDELPQLWNVLKGDMSIVGPRPHCTEEIELYYDRDEYRVFTVKPGITSFSQIHGRSYVTLRDELKYEIYYIQNWSLWLDIHIIWETLVMVLQRKNVV